MTAHSVHHARSGRFVKTYLLAWGLLAAGALTYLGSLAWQPELITATKSQPQQVAEHDSSLRAATKALAQIGTVQRSVGEMQKDLGQLKETVDQHAAQGKLVQSRLAALEERVTVTEVPVARSAPPAKQKVAEKHLKAADKPQVRTAEPRQPTRMISTTIEAPALAAPSEVTPAPIETGSIAQAPIVFGDAVVTTTSPVVTTATGAVAATSPSSPFAVQLAAGPSLDALRLSWGVLVERHGAALASLQPRFVAPRNGGGPYRLIAGPLPTKADADKVCTEMGVGRNGCFSTTFIGEPL
jgi:sporulation related protein